MDRDAVMGSLSMSFGDGEWHHVAGPIVDGESPIEEAQRIAHLAEAETRAALKFACPKCGELGAMRPGNDRFHVEKCPGGAA